MGGNGRSKSLTWALKESRWAFFGKKAREARAESSPPGSEASRGAALFLTQLLPGKDNGFLLVISALTVVVAGVSIVISLKVGVGGAETFLDVLTIVMTVGIYPLVFYGLHIAHGLLKGVSSETVQAEILIDKGRTFIGRLKAGVAAAPTLDHLENMLPFDASGNRASGTHRMLVRIIQDARDFTFERREGLVDAYRAEKLRSMEQLSAVQNLALRLGILGTFIGLILAMPELSRYVGSTEVTLSAITHELFAALRLAFGTSIAGLEVAIVIGIVIIYVQRRYERLFQHVDEAAGVMLTLARNAYREDKGLFSSFAQMQASMERLEARLHSEAARVASGVDHLAGRVLEQTSRIDQGLLRLATLRDEWAQFLNQMSQSERDLVASLTAAEQSVLKLATERDQAVEGRVARFLDRLDEEQKQFVDDAREVFDLLSLGTLASDIRQSVERAGASIAGALEGRLGELATRMDTVKTSSDGLLLAGTNLGAGMQHLATMISGASTHLQSVERGAAQIEQFVTRMEKAQGTFVRDLEGCFERISARPIDDKIKQDLLRVGAQAFSPVEAKISSAGDLLAELRDVTRSLTTVATTLRDRLPEDRVRYIQFFLGGMGVAAGVGILLMIAKATDIF